MGSILDDELFNITDEKLIFDKVIYYLKKFDKIYSFETVSLEGYYRKPAKNEDVYIFISKPGTNLTKLEPRRVLYVPKRYWDKKNYKGKYGYKSHGPYQQDYDYINKHYTRVCRSNEPKLSKVSTWTWKYVKKSDKIGVTLKHIIDFPAEEL